jgi:hypothetical protein
MIVTWRTIGRIFTVASTTFVVALLLLTLVAWFRSISGLLDPEIEYAGLLVLVFSIRLLILVFSSAPTYWYFSRCLSGRILTTDILAGCILGIISSTVLVFWWNFLPSVYYSGGIIPSCPEFLLAVITGVVLGGSVGRATAFF